MSKVAENYTRSTELDDTFVFSHIQLGVAQYKSGNLGNDMAAFRKTSKAPTEERAVQLLVSVSFSLVSFRC